MLPLVQSKPTVFICPYRLKSGCVKARRRKREQSAPVLLKQLTDQAVFVVVLAFHVLVAGTEKIGILFRERLELGDRNQLVTSEIAYLVFHISLFPARFRVHKDGFEAVMLGKAAESIGKISTAAFYNLRDNGFGIVKPDLGGNASNVFKHRLQSLQKAFQIFSIVQLQVTAIAIWKTEYKILAIPVIVTVLNEVSRAKVGLSLSRMVDQWNIPLLLP